MHRLAAALGLCSRFSARSVTSTSTAIFRRSIAASASRHASEAAPTDEAVGSESFGNVAAEPMAEEGGETPRSYRHFLQQIGHQYRYARPRSWLGGDVVKYSVFGAAILCLPPHSWFTFSHSP